MFPYPNERSLSLRTPRFLDKSYPSHSYANDPCFLSLCFCFPFYPSVSGVSGLLQNPQIRPGTICQAPGLCIKLPILLKIVFFSLHPGGQPRDEVLLLQNPVYGKTELRSGNTLIGMFLQDSHETLSLSKMPGLLFLADLSVLQVPGLHLHSEPMSCRDGF